MEKIESRLYKLGYTLLVLSIITAGLAARLFDMDDAPLDFHPTRQLRLALISRGIYYANLDGIEEWQRQKAVTMGMLEGVLEPQIMENLTAGIYQWIGREDLAIGRLLGIIFWMVGGAGLFLVARDLGGRVGAAAALAFYLLQPYAIIASRSFQPDGLMICLTIFCFWTVNRWRMSQRWSWAVLAGILGGFAILVKTMAVFFVGGAWLGVLISTFKPRDFVRSGQVWAAGILTVLPVLVYYFQGIFISGTIGYIFSQRFFPQMWLTASFYLRWLVKVREVVGLEWLLAGVVGVFLAENRSVRAMLLGIWGGYGIFAMIFAHFSATHDYYHLPLLPLVALGVALASRLIQKNIKVQGNWANIILAGFLILWGGINVYDARTTLKRKDYRQEVEFWKTLGQKIGPDTSVLALTQDYGMRLEYWGWVIPMNWPTAGDLAYNEKGGQPVDVQELISEKLPGRDFFVVTMLEELVLQPELNKTLGPYPVFDQGSTHVVYDLRSGGAR